MALEQADESHCLYDFSFDEKTVLVIGHERHGVSNEDLKLVDDVIEIPVYGRPLSYKRRYRYNHGRLRILSSVPRVAHMPDLSPEQIEEILLAVNVGRKIEAIKLYRKWKNCSLMIAKNHIERIQQAGEYVEFHDTESGDGEIADDHMEQILDAIQIGNKIEAVKIYKSCTGESLMNSKLFIEKLMKELEISDPSFVGKNPGCVLCLFCFSVISYFLIVA